MLRLNKTTAKTSFICLYSFCLACTRCVYDHDYNSNEDTYKVYIEIKGAMCIIIVEREKIYNTQYLTEVNTPSHFVNILLYLFIWNTEEIHFSTM